MTLSFVFYFPALVITDGGQDKSGLADEVGSEDDLYNEFRSSSNRFGHPGGGGGEQLAINEVGYRICTCVLQFTCIQTVFNVCIRIYCTNK